MRKIILDLAVTLDGFIEGPNGETDWCIMDDDMGFDNFLSTIDTIFYGRISYGAWGSFQPDKNANENDQAFWRSVHSKKKYVFTSKDIKDDRVNIINTDIAGRVIELKQEQGKDIWLYGGASLITTFMQQGLIDVYRISVHPVVLGGGKPLFAEVKSRLDLRLAETNIFKSGVVQLIYEPLPAI